MKAVVADFAEMRTLDDYTKLVSESALAGMDIGAVFLNAGVVKIGPYDLLPTEEIEMQVRVNMLHPLYLAKALLPKLMAR